MRFIAYRELVKALGFSNENDEDLNSESLKRAIQEQLTELEHINISGRSVNQNELFDLITLYDNKENRVFSDWVLSDEVLSSFLDERLNQQVGEVKMYKDHFLEEKYKAFNSRFLFAKLRTETSTVIESDNLNQLALFLELSLLLPHEDKFIVQQQVADCIEKKLGIPAEGEQAMINQLLSVEFSTIIQKLEDSFYALKVNYVKTLKNQLENGRISRSKAQTLWKQIGLNKAHLAELENYMDTHQETFPKTKRRSFMSLVSTPAFLFITLLVVILTLLFLPRNGIQEMEILEVQQKRSGLDSLSKDEVVLADTVLGYKGKGDSSTLESNLTPDL
jgi:prophage antirepressor-like protein